MLMYPAVNSLNSVRDLRGLIAKESVKGLSRSPFFMECNSTVGSRSYIYIARILNQPKYSLNGFVVLVVWCSKSLRYSCKLGSRRTYLERLMTVQQSCASSPQVETRTIIGQPFSKNVGNVL